MKMNDFVRCNKLSGVHWLRGCVDKLEIKITVKLPDEIISLPKFEDYTDETSNINIAQNIEQFTFKWQEKCFSECEIKRYKDVHNCLTENELGYHELVIRDNITSSKVFSYIHEDYFMPLPREKKKNASLLNSFLERFSLDDAVGIFGDVGEKSASERHLFKSQEDVREEDELWTSMHVVYDNSDYNESTVLLKQEAVMVSLYHNINHNYVIITPDVNKLDANPYMLETASGDFLGHQYEVDVDFREEGASEELVTLLSKLYQKWEKRHNHLINFVMPLLGLTHYYVTIDLLTARGFETDNLYVKYDIKFPESLRCKDVLHGRTHVADAIEIDGADVCHFGHVLELCLEKDSGTDPPPLTMYFEAISTDYWHRHRTEGYCYHQIPLTPGVRSQELRCVRPDEKGAEERRFFLGGCHLIKDLEVLSRPGLQNGHYTFTETGTILLRIVVVSQSSLPTASGSEGHYETSTASALLLGAEAALRKYKKARARLVQATTMPD